MEGWTLELIECDLENTLNFIQRTIKQEPILYVESAIMYNKEGKGISIDVICEKHLKEDTIPQLFVSMNIGETNEYCENIGELSIDNLKKAVDTANSKLLEIRDKVQEKIGE